MFDEGQGPYKEEIMTVAYMLSPKTCSVDLIVFTDMQGVVANGRQWKRLFRSSTSLDVLPVPAHPHLGVLPTHLAAGVSENFARGAPSSRRRHGPDDPPLQSESHQNAACCRRIFRLVMVTVVRTCY